MNIAQFSSPSVFLAAQSFAAELSTKDGVTNLLIGGGYGLTSLSKMGEPLDPAALALLQQCGKDPEWDTEHSMTPDVRNEVFHVEIHDEMSECFAERSARGIGWEWSFLDLPSSLLPSMNVDLRGGSSTLYLAMRACDEDFSEPPRGAVLDNDEDAVFGRRVTIDGLVSRRHLNGSIGRAGCWIPSTGRCKVLVPKGESGGPCSVAVRPRNLTSTRSWIERVNNNGSAYSIHYDIILKVYPRYSISFGCGPSAERAE